MRKKSKQTKLNFLYIFSLILVVAFLGGLSGYFLQMRENDSANHELISEINSLHSKLVSMSLSNSGKSAVPEVKNSAKEMPETPAQSEIRFNSCMKLSGFRNMQWYEDLKAESESYGIDLSDSSSACLSDSAGLLVFLIPPKETCTASDIYRFDVSRNSLAKASLSEDAGKCLGTVWQFGARNGNVIRLKGQGEKDGCEWNDYFDYDFLNNTVKVTESTGSCN